MIYHLTVSETEMFFFPYPGRKFRKFFLFLFPFPMGNGISPSLWLGAKMCFVLGPSRALIFVISYHPILGLSFVVLMVKPNETGIITY